MASKLGERFYLDIFLEKLPGFELIDEDREAPDFLLRDDAGFVGIELRAVYRVEQARGSSERAVEARRNRKLRDVADRYYSAPQAAPICLTLYTPPWEQEPSVERIVSTLWAARPGSPGTSANLTAEGSTLHVIWLARTAEFQGYRRGWADVRNSSGKVGLLAARDLQQKIDEKAPRLGAYQEEVSRVILLLHADRSRTSAFFEIDPDCTRLDSRGFERVYLLMHPGELTLLASFESERESIESSTAGLD